MLSEPFFTRMYRAHYEYVRRMLVKYGVAGRDSEDTAHDVFRAVWEQLCCYDRRRSFKCWLFCFILRFASDYRRRARYDREELQGYLWWVLQDAPSVEDMLLAQADRQMAVQAVERLSPAGRAVLKLHAKGWTMPEIVARLGIPLDTGYTRLRRARAQLCRHVAKIAGGPPVAPGR